MAPKRKNQNSATVVIPPIDPNSQLPFAGNHMSVVSESDLLRLVDVGVLPSKVLCSWWICRGVTVPTEDTHESVVYVHFLIRDLALPISPFFHGLLDFYNLNPTHLNPNSILQISIFVHLCEAYLGILPHLGLWKYLYHCRPGMAGGQHQLVGGASLEMRRGRKTEYLDIPLKDNIKGWRLEWFIVENHDKSLPPRSGRQLDVRTPSWVESPTALEVEMSKWAVPVGRPVARHGFGPSRTRHDEVVDGPGPARLVSRAGFGPLPWHAVPARAQPSFFILFSSAFICILEATLIV
jgi:hypothetical protein